MIANLVGRLTLPEPTLSDEVCGRIYYALSSVVDLAQTVAKVARSVFTTSLAFLFLGQSSALNSLSNISWNDVGFSLQMLGCSILGILSPRTAWVKKCDLHITNAANAFTGNGVDFSGLLMEEWNRGKDFAVRCFLIGQLAESGLRFVASAVRYGAAKAMVALSLNNAKFVDLLADGAHQSADSAREEMRIFSQAAFS